MFSLCAFPFRDSDLAVIRPHFFRSYTKQNQIRRVQQNRYRRFCAEGIVALALGALSLVSLSGCGANYTVNSAGIGPFQASTDAVEFGSVTVGQTSPSSVTLVNQGSTEIQVSALKVTGNDFKVANATTLPLTVAAGSTYSVAVQFKPKASGDSTGQLTISSTSTTSPSLKVKLHGKGTTQSTGGTTTPALQSF
jgi:hypothetical protein